MSYIIISTFSSPFLSLLVVSTPPCIHHLPFSFLLAWAGESSWYQEDPAGLDPGACELLSQLLLEHNNFLHNLLTVHTEQQQQQQKKLVSAFIFPQLCFHVLVGTQESPKVSFPGINGSLSFGVFFVGTFRQNQTTRLS